MRVNELAGRLVNLRHTNVDEDDLNFKVELLKYFWNNRDTSLIPIGSVSGVEKEKFLFFYNIFAYLNGKHFTFKNLKSFAEGPVYYDVYVLTAKENIFLETSVETNKVVICQEIGKAVLTLLELFRKNASHLSHLDLWEKNYDKDYNEKNREGNNANDIEVVVDITEKDEERLRLLYSELLKINNGYLIHTNKKGMRFLIEKSNRKEILEKFSTRIDEYSKEGITPTYVYLTEGELDFD